MVKLDEDLRLAHLARLSTSHGYPLAALAEIIIRHARAAILYLVRVYFQRLLSKLVLDRSQQAALNALAV